MTDQIQQARRAAFEAWVTREAKKRDYCHLPTLLIQDSMGGYQKEWVDMAWLGFYAAIDSLCIELPELAEVEYDAGYTVLERCRAAIKQTNMGIKIK